MISDPDFFLDQFVEAGSDSFLVHWEGNNNLHRTVQRIKTLRKRGCVAIQSGNPSRCAGRNPAGRRPNPCDGPSIRVSDTSISFMARFR
jgi:hypothetical protein